MEFRRGNRGDAGQLHPPARSPAPLYTEVMANAHTDGQPVIRGLFHEFPDDPHAWDVSDQYMFGPEVLVAPVIEAGARSRSVYLPGGATWTNAYTGETHTGGQMVVAEAPLDVIPSSPATTTAVNSENIWSL